MPKKRVRWHARVLAATVGAVVTPVVVAGLGVSPAHADDLPYVALDGVPARMDRCSTSRAATTTASPGGPAA